MEARIQKWGNSLAVRIPKPFAAEVGIDVETQVDLTVENGKLVIAPVAKSSYRLRDLLTGVSESNIHGEVDLGEPVGRETW